MQFLDLVGFLLPPLIDTINRYVQNTNLRFWVSVLVCAVVGTLLHFMEIKDLLPLDADALAASILQVFAMAQLSYKAVWEKSAVRESLSLDATKIK